MYRHSPVRNPRSKGIKIKQVLQVCVLLAVCFWLIFQVKRSHDKKKEFDDTKISLKNTITQSNDEILKLGRKDIQPKLEKEAEILEEHEDQEEPEHEHEEQEQEHEKEDEEEEKIEEEKDDGGGGGDDEIDENEQEKETEVTEESEEKDENEKGVSLEDHEEDETTIHTHEGREEHYKADDASSAVTHEARILSTENATSDNSNEELDNGETPINGTSFSNTHENGPPSSTTFDTSEPQNVTSEESSKSSEDQNDTGEQQADNYNLASNESEESLNSSSIPEVLKSNELNSSDTLKPEVESETDEENMEGNNVIEGTEEILDQDEVEHDDTHLEEKEVRMDLDTLPEIETEGGDSEDTAAE